MHTSAHCEIKNVREVSKLFEAVGAPRDCEMWRKKPRGAVSICEQRSGLNQKAQLVEQWSGRRVIEISYRGNSV
jgi:hypothetical protein